MLSLLVGRPERKDDVMDYVLEDFTRNERNQLSAMKETMIDTVHQIVAVMLSPPGMRPFSYWLYNFCLQSGNAKCLGVSSPFTSHHLLIVFSKVPNFRHLVQNGR